MFPHVLGHSCHRQQDRDTGLHSPYLCFPTCCGMGAQSRVRSGPRPMLCSALHSLYPLSWEWAGSAVFSLGSEHRPWLHSVTVWICHSLLWFCTSPTL